MKPISYKNRKGFTLIEILVVVSIIASISSVVLVGIKAAQANGRDSARNSNSLQVRNALALYETEHGGVPSGEGVDGCDPQTVDDVTSYVCKGSTAVEAVLGDALVPQYIPHIPVDVVNTNGLEYSYISGPADPALTEANSGLPTTQTASFNYVSELKSTDPVEDPVVVTIPIGVSDIVRYPDTGYPSGYLIVSPTITSFTGPGLLTTIESGTYSVGVSNPDATTLTYSFDWGDSSVDYLTSSGTSLTANHNYATVGNYTIVVTVIGRGSPVDASLSVVVSTPPPQLLNWSKSGSGKGSISSSPIDIACTSACSGGSGSFPYGLAFTLTATPDSGSTFTGWGGACSGTGTCSVLLNSGRSVTATFVLIPAPVVDLWVGQGVDFRNLGRFASNNTVQTGFPPLIFNMLTEWSNSNATSCNLVLPSFASFVASGGNATSGWESIIVHSYQNSITFTLNCTGPGGSGSDSVTLVP